MVKILLNADQVLRAKLCDFLAVKDVVWLIENAHAEQILGRDYQRKFNRVFRVRRNQAWQEKFYGLFAECSDEKQRTRVTLGDILPKLDERVAFLKKTPQLELSFASKMLAVLRPKDFPIWDSQVVKVLNDQYHADLVYPDREESLKEREEKSLKQYAWLTKWYQGALRQEGVKESLRIFDEYLPVDLRGKISKMKKLDWLIWSQGGSSCADDIQDEL